MTFDDIAEFLRDEVDERLFATGGQLYVSVAKEPVLDLAVGVDGIDSAVTSETLFLVYCAGKPFVATAVGCLVDDGELSLDDEIGHVVERDLPPELAGLRVSHLLDHTAGLHDLDTFTFLGSAEKARNTMVLSCRPPAAWRVGEDVGYCQIAGWELLRWAIDDLAGMPTAGFIDKRVLEPAGVGNEVFIGGMTEEQFADQVPRLGVNVHLTGLSGDPMLTDRNRRFRCVTSAAGGNSASARGLGRFYEALLDVAQGREGIVSAEVMGTLTSPQSRGVDVMMGRECSYGYGFMVDLAEHDFGRSCGSGSFGHSGYGGMSAALCDPERDLVVAFHFNGRVDSDTSVKYHRPMLIENLYKALADEL